MSVTKDFLKDCIDQAMGRRRADLVIKGAALLNVVTGETHGATSPSAATASSAPMTNTGASRRSTVAI